MSTVVVVVFGCRHFIHWFIQFVQFVHFICSHSLSLVPISWTIERDDRISIIQWMTISTELMLNNLLLQYWPKFLPLSPSQSSTSFFYGLNMKKKNEKREWWIRFKIYWLNSSCISYSFYSIPFISFHSFHSYQYIYIIFFLISFDV